MPVDWSESVELRPVTMDDATFLQALDAEVRCSEFAAAGLPAEMLTSLLAMQYRARASEYVAHYPHAVNSIVWVGTERAGRLLVDHGTEALRVVDIALTEGFRGRGLGTVLLRDVCERARGQGLPVRLAVRVDNPAQRLYQRLGFVVTSTDDLERRMEYKP